MVLLRCAGLGGGRGEGVGAAGATSASTCSAGTVRWEMTHALGVQHQGRADGHAGRDGDAASDFHATA